MGIEDQARYAIPSVHVVDDEKLQGQYQEPIPPGGSMPQLGLAGEGINVASGESFQAQPDPPKPEIVWPSLSGSPDCGGVDPTNSSPPAPDLAGCGGGFSQAASGPILPSYGQPDWSSLNLGLVGGSDDIANSAINYSPGGEWGMDPANPDVTDYRHPMGLEFHQSSPADIFKPDPVTGDLTDPEIPGGISVIDHPADPDPMVPDLQNPQLTPDVTMQGRPGDMDPGAMDALHNSPDYQNVSGVAYDISPMVQPGSTRRSRHMDLLMDGLK
jgi:hypothetical protein